MPRSLSKCLSTLIITLRKAISSPWDTLLPSLSETNATALPYLPTSSQALVMVILHTVGCGCVDGVSVSGRKVTLVYGDTISGLMLGTIAEDLVQQGYRVMLIDPSTSWISSPAFSATGSLATGLWARVVVAISRVTLSTSETSRYAACLF